MAATPVAIPKTVVDAKGDLLVGTGSDAITRQPVGSDGQVLTADAAQATGVKWAAGGGGGSSADASTTVKGLSKLSTAPASPTNPIAAGDNDPRLTDQRVPTDGSVTAAKVNGTLKPSGSAASTDESLRRLGTGATHAAAGDDSRFPSAGEKNALAGTSGTPGTGNKYVTDGDARNANARTPTAHASSHQPGGSDAMAVDAAAATGSLRTLGTGAAQAAAGNHGHAEADVTGLVADLAAKAPLASPTFTGTPAAPTAGSGTNTTQLATTAFVQTASGLLIPKALLTAKGSTIGASAAGTPVDVPVGSNGQVFTADSAQAAGVKWATPSGIAATLVDAKGDLLVGTADDTIARKAAGTNGRFLRADSTQSDGLKWDDVPVILRGTGVKVAPQFGSLAYAFAAPTLNRLYLAPIYIPAGTCNLIGTTINGAAAAGGLVRVGLYDASNGMPNAKLTESTAIASDSTGGKSYDPALTIPVAGWYFVAVVYQVAAPATVALATGLCLGMPPRTYSTEPYSERDAAAWKVDSITGAMPSTYSAGVSPVTDAIVNAGPVVQVKVN